MTFFRSRSRWTGGWLSGDYRVASVFSGWNKLLESFFFFGNLLYSETCRTFIFEICGFIRLFNLLWDWFWEGLTGLDLVHDIIISVLVFEIVVLSTILVLISYLNDITLDARKNILLFFFFKSYVVCFHLFYVFILNCLFTSQRTPWL